MPDDPIPHSAFRTPHAGTALVLFSGGQDSTTCLYWAKENFGRIEALGFRYGQRHAVELRQAAKIAALAGVPYTVLDLSGTLSGSALLDAGDVNAPHAQAPDLPASFVPGRNAVFLAHAAAFAFARGLRDGDGALHLVGGMCEADFSGYPDCRADFVHAMARALGLGLGAALYIHTPLMHRTKAETWKLAADLGCLDVVVEHTHTDYGGDRSERHPWGYGRLDNPASVLRAKGFEEAKANGWI